MVLLRSCSIPVTGDSASALRIPLPRRETQCPFSLILILNGRRGRGVVSVVPQGLRRAAVACGTGPAGRSCDMDAAFMSFQQHGSGNHAVPARCRRGERGRSPFPAAPWLLARRAQTKINLA